MSEHARRKAQLKSQSMLKQNTTASSFIGKDANSESSATAANYSTGKRRLGARDQAFHGSAKQAVGAPARDAKSEGGRLLLDL